MRTKTTIIGFAALICSAVTFAYLGPGGGGSGGGGITGPGSTTVNAYTLWNSTDGTVVKDSPFTLIPITDSGAQPPSTSSFQQVIANGLFTNSPLDYGCKPGTKFVGDSNTVGDGFVWYGDSNNSIQAWCVNGMLTFGIRNYHSDDHKEIIAFAPIRPDSNLTVGGILITNGTSVLPWPQVYGMQYLFGNGNAAGENMYFAMTGHTTLGLGFNTTTGADAVLGIVAASADQKQYLHGSSTSVGWYTADDSTSNGTASLDYVSHAQNKTAGTGNGGMYETNGGTSAGGVAGGNITYDSTDSAVRGYTSVENSSTLTDYFNPSAVKGGKHSVRRSLGTRASPTALTGFPSGNNTSAIGSYDFEGYDGTAYGLGATLWASARDNWTGADHATDVHFSSVTTGTTLADYMVFSQSQVLFPLGAVAGSGFSFQATSFRPFGNARRVIYSIYNADVQSNPTYGIGSDASATLAQIYFHLAGNANADGDAVQFNNGSTGLDVHGADDSAVNSTKAANIGISGGNKSAGTGDGGDAYCEGGSSAGGARGTCRVPDGLTVNTTTTKPTCAANNRGQIWVVQGGTGVADIPELCMKDALEAYSWHTFATTP